MITVVNEEQYLNDDGPTVLICGLSVRLTKLVQYSKADVDMFSIVGPK